MEIFILLVLLFALVLYNAAVFYMFHRYMNLSDFKLNEKETKVLFLIFIIVIPVIYLALNKWFELINLILIYLIILLVYRVNQKKSLIVAGVWFIIDYVSRFIMLAFEYIFNLCFFEMLNSIAGKNSYEIILNILSLIVYFISLYVLTPVIYKLYVKATGLK